MLVFVKIKVAEFYIFLSLLYKTVHSARSLYGMRPCCA